MTSVTPRKAQPSEYERLFPPFFVQSHTTLAPSNRFSRDPQGAAHVTEKLDEALAGNQRVEAEVPSNLAKMLNIMLHRLDHCQRHAIPVKEIIARIHGTADNPIDLTSGQSQKALQTPLDLLKAVPTKFLKFAEDVRPPYIGTYTKPLDIKTSNKLRRNPFTRALPSTDYDYDSEAEWEEPGEGEDLDSEGEEELDDEEADDMEGFLDDAEADEVKKRRPIIGDLEPTSTGLCWEDSHRNTIRESDSSLNLRAFKLDIILSK